MRYHSGQFGSFDGLDNRRELFQLIARLGRDLPEVQAGVVRARFLQSLIGLSRTGLDGKPLRVTPCSAIQAYHLFVAITGCLGVDINVAANKLARFVGTR